LNFLTIPFVCLQQEFFPSREDKQPSPPPCMAMEDKLDLDLDFPTSIPLPVPALLDLI
jgi:hypothetical protein